MDVAGTAEQAWWKRSDSVVRYQSGRDGLGDGEAGMSHAFEEVVTPRA